MFPTLYLSHGGGPMPLLGEPSHAGIIKHFESLGSGPLQGEKPGCILVVSAHWATDGAHRVTTNPEPPLLFDYYGFPPAAYQVRYPAPGSPRVAQRIMDLLAGAGIKAEADPDRGYDHGVFVPLKMIYPDADIPVVCLSLHADLDPAHHLRLGEALAPLRAEGVLIIGSGSSFHNMRLIMGGDRRRCGEASATFDAYLQQLVRTDDAAKRRTMLEDWASAPMATEAHPLGAEEHLIPLHVVAGAAGVAAAVPTGAPAAAASGDEKSSSAGSVIFSGSLLGSTMSSFMFGQVVASASDEKAAL